MIFAFLKSCKKIKEGGKEGIGEREEEGEKREGGKDAERKERKREEGMEGGMQRQEKGGGSRGKGKEGRQ